MTKRDSGADSHSGGQPKATVILVESSKLMHKVIAGVCTKRGVTVCSCADVGSALTAIGGTQAGSRAYGLRAARAVRCIG